MKNIRLGILVTILLWANLAFSQVSTKANQLIVAIASDWNAPVATMQCWQRESINSPWQPAFKQPWPVNLGRNGLAWGRGVFTPSDAQIPWKVEKDGKAPAGIFELGPIHGYAMKPPAGTTWPYLQVGPWDAWIDDPRLPKYNEHVRIDPNNIPPWFEHQRMRLGDAAYKWLFEIRHNTNPAKSGYGSAIFFHIRRGPTTPSAGCTTMAVENLETMIRWVQPTKYPYYVLLPQNEYNKLRKAWGLP